jgi:hypothetical protein
MDNKLPSVSPLASYFKEFLGHFEDHEHRTCFSTPKFVAGRYWRLHDLATCYIEIVSSATTCVTTESDDCHCVL